MHINNKNKDTFILWEGPKQRLMWYTLTAEAKYPKVYTIMEAAVSSLLMLQKYINSKQKTHVTKDYALSLDNISKDFTINNMKKQD